MVNVASTTLPMTMFRNVRRFICVSPFKVTDNGQHDAWSLRASSGDPTRPVRIESAWTTVPVCPPWHADHGASHTAFHSTNLST